MPIPEPPAKGAAKGNKTNFQALKMQYVLTLKAFISEPVNLSCPLLWNCMRRIV